MAARLFVWESVDFGMYHRGQVAVLAEDQNQAIDQAVLSYTDLYGEVIFHLTPLDVRDMLIALTQDGNYSERESPAAIVILGND